jgi:N-carbamoyl-L-amino-acid hydrolase
LTQVLGSSAAAGSLNLEDIRDLKDRQGTRLVDALAENGVGIDTMLNAQRELKTIDARAYLELHIEQGPVLESMGKSTGVVLGTFGVERHMLRFTGQAAHPGSTRFRCGATRFSPPPDRAGVPRDRAPGSEARRAGRAPSRGQRGAEDLPRPRCLRDFARPGALDADVLAAMLRDARDASERYANDSNVAVDYKRL